MRSPIGVLIFLSVMLLMDTYVFQIVMAVSETCSPVTRVIIFGVYWSFTLISVILFLLFIYKKSNHLGNKIRVNIFAIIIGIFLAKLIAIMIFFVDDLRRVIQWVFTELFYRDNLGINKSDYNIARSAFLNWLGIATGSTLFGTLLYGFSNKYNYQVTKHKLSFTNLPESFRGLKIVHISDIHSGSLLDKKAVESGIKKILELEADLILFTGDLVNDKATEMEHYKDLFSQLKAPLGVYSILGNHDYGDYIRWPIDGISKEQNLQDLKQIHSDMGWRLLMNEHVVLERNNEQIALLGIENWGNKARFPKYGRMDLAYAGAEKYPFKILMSHDPSHWHGQVKKEYNDIDLMLSGHTHGMQFGFEIFGFKWSPVQYMYKEWAGLYEDSSNKLYVNRGFGFIGYPGRVGILPEITVLEFI